MIKKICTIDKIKKELDIDFDNLELVGSYKTARNNKISSVSKVEKIESEKEPNCFMTTMINGIMYYIKYKELLYITKCDRKYNYIHFKNGKTLVKGDLLIEDAEMVMIKMLGDFINEEVVKQWGG